MRPRTTMRMVEQRQFQLGVVTALGSTPSVRHRIVLSGVVHIGMARQKATV